MGKFVDSESDRLTPSLALSIVLSLALLAACGSAAVRWQGYDVLRDRPPPVARAIGGVPISDPAEYEQFRRWGEQWFRTETFGAEVATTDVAGLFGAELEVPCAAGGETGSEAVCRQTVSALPYLIRALDQLDGVPGNLFQGNGGPLGEGFTSDLVLEFPPGTTLAGLPVPERLHTGLDVDAGAAWPIGIMPVAAPEADAALPYLIEPAALGAGAAPPGKLRLGITCALCHYSLDVDKDGTADVRSSRWDELTPGSSYTPQDTWAIGNQDVHFGWLFALTQNPLLGLTVLSGPVGKNHPETSLEWVRWVKARYREQPEVARREVIRGMLVQPRGFADDTPNALHDPNQLPVLFTRDNWPYNFDGSFIHPADRNNGVWTGALDFTGLIALANDRSSRQQRLLYWEPPSVYEALDADEYADVMVDRSPAARFDATRRQQLKEDILGCTDGIPGVLRPDSVIVMENTLGSLPQCVLKHPGNIQARRIRTAASFGGDAERRGSMMVLLGTRVVSTPAVRRDFQLEELARRHPGLNVDEFQSNAVSLWLDSLTPPKNRTPLLAGAKQLVAEGYQIFQEEGCASCHRGPFLTDNLVHRLSARREEEIGIAAASTAGFRALGRGAGPAIETGAYRALSTRALALYVAPDFDPDTGLATAKGSIPGGLLGAHSVGYKTLTLRHLWASAPYLHDGGVGVALAPDAGPAGNDLQALLSRPASQQLSGMGRILAQREQAQSGGPWPNAALSLQALLLESERARVLAGNRARIVSVPIGTADNPLDAPPLTSLALLGVVGAGHSFWIHDVPGGPRITRLIAFLLALDDDPAELP
jgi:mono/diheme cytochrome c family protein